MEPEDSFLYSQQLATCPFPDQDRTGPRYHPNVWRSILILSSHLLLDLPSGLFPWGLPTKPCIHVSFKHKRTRFIYEYAGLLLKTSVMRQQEIAA